MHVIFGVSTLVMAVATLWLLAKDHNREWKDWQLKDRKKDAWVIQANRDALAAQFADREKTYEADLLVAESQPIDAALTAQFKELVLAERQRLGEKTPDFARLDARQGDLGAAVAEIAQAGDAAAADLLPLREAARRARGKVLGEMVRYVREASFREKTLVDQKKIVNGYRTAAVSKKGLQIHDGAPQQALDATQQEIDGYDQQLGELTAGIAGAKEFRTSLEGVVDKANEGKASLAKELSSIQTELARLDEQVFKNTSNVGEWVTRWPVLNALYDGNVRIEQNWLPDLTINYNFSNVARFDRCTTCHRAISKTVPGAADQPLYPAIPPERREMTLALDAPAEPPPEGSTLLSAYGMELSKRGIIEDGDVTVHYVLPETLAAKAGLQSGDVIRRVGEARAGNPAAVSQLLLELRSGTKPVDLHVRRGLDQPFTTHPRLDLFLTDLSPHPQKVVGCTVCHDGQGSGTDFKWTSHTPDNAKQQSEWIREYGWFDNHHWIFPMKPARFVESNCLKCHHQKGGLEPSERFPEHPAPKVVEGWTLVEEYGCFGCHEVNGYAAPGQTVGPDVRLEPNFHEVAAQLLRDENLTDRQRQLARQLIAAPDRDDVRHELLASVEQDSQLAANPETQAEALLSAKTHDLASLLKDVEIPGRYRKAGPSLRHLASKVDFPWLYNWIRRPADFRPTTKMPQFFEQYHHLSEAEDADQLHASMQFEPIEIRALSKFLLDASVSFDKAAAPAEVTEQPSAERGKWLFESRGCLACHAHEQFPGIAQNQGPELSRLQAKFDHPGGREWLYAWLKDPHRYSPRTKMPNLYLDPIAEKDAQGVPTGKVTDPAADLAAFLLEVPTDWTEGDVPANASAPLSSEEEQALADLALAWLASDAIPRERAQRYLQEGIPARLEPRLKADEKVLVGITDENRIDRQLEFVARRTIGKYGCFGCHDIPGYEDAKPIGAALADWGRKETSKIAFENIQTFLSNHGIHPPNPADAAGHAAAGHAAAGHAGGMVASAAGAGDAAHAHGHLDPLDFDDDSSYFVQAINSHARDGFLWQKLRMPRSYDYKTTRNKSFNDRLRMPKFPFTDAQREAVMTFVLGLVVEPPADKFVYKPDPRQQAIVDGREVLEKYNCSGCHALKTEQWEFAFQDGTFDSAPQVEDYPFLTSRFTEKQVADSLKVDGRGMLHATVHGTPIVDETTGQPYLVDEDRQPITLEELAEIEAEEGETVPVFYPLTLWRDALVAGETRFRGVEELLIPAAREGYGPANGTAHPAWGGDLSRYLFDKVVARAREVNPQVNAKEAWGWLPPPLMDEGEKVQTDWLHGFLMDPMPLRPAVVMRMPNFRMSSDDAAKLVNYFAAASGAEFPYEYRPQQQPNYLASLAAEREKPLDEAMKIVVNGNYCVKCHGVADFYPQGSELAFGPNLAGVYRRLRPDYLRNWIANPARILPYTGMPVNIPFRAAEAHLGGVSQELFRGTSVEQVEGLVNLLMNFDAYAKGKAAVSSLVQGAAAPPAGAPANQPAEAEEPKDEAAAADEDLSGRQATRQ